MKKYTKEIEEIMKKIHNTLPEKGKRLYAGSEAEKIGYGGNTYIANLLECNRKTVERGKIDLKHIEDIPKYRNRREGGGRKSCIDIIEGIDEVFLSVLKEHTAGDPDNEKIKWTNLTQEEICNRMKESGISISCPVIKQLLNKYGYVKRKALKKTVEEVKNRKEQFEKIKSLKEKYMQSENPIINTDTKKKEAIGDYYRDGHLYTQETVNVLDHDFPESAKVKAVPHGIYDIKQNKGYINIGVSKDTGEFKGKSSISKSKSYKETGEFWDSHDLGEFWDKTEKADFEVDIESNITYYALDNNLSTQIQSISRQRGISPETLINLWIQEKLQTIDEKVSRS